MFEPKATKQELMQLRVEQSRELDELGRELTNRIDSRIAELHVENDILCTELTTLKADKQPVVETQEITRDSGSVIYTFKDAKGNINSQIKITLDGITITVADKSITFNGKAVE